MDNAPLELGQQVKHKSSDYIGTVTGIASYLNIPVRRICVTAKQLQQGKVIEMWFDETTLTPEPPAQL